AEFRRGLTGHVRRVTDPGEDAVVDAEGGGEVVLAGAEEDLRVDEQPAAHQTSSTAKVRLGDTNSSWAATSRISREPASSVRWSRPNTDAAARASASPAERLSSQCARNSAAMASPAPFTDTSSRGVRTRKCRPPSEASRSTESSGVSSVTSDV